MGAGTPRAERDVAERSGTRAPRCFRSIRFAGTAHLRPAPSGGTQNSVRTRDERVGAHVRPSLVMTQGSRARRCLAAAAPRPSYRHLVPTTTVRPSLMAPRLHQLVCTSRDVFCCNMSDEKSNDHNSNDFFANVLSRRGIVGAAARTLWQEAAGDHAAPPHWPMEKRRAALQPASIGRPFDQSNARAESSADEKPSLFLQSASMRAASTTRRSSSPPSVASK